MHQAGPSTKRLLRHAHTRALGRLCIYPALYIYPAFILIHRHCRHPSFLRRSPSNTISASLNGGSPRVLRAVLMIALTNAARCWSRLARVQRERAAKSGTLLRHTRNFFNIGVSVFKTQLYRDLPLPIRPVSWRSQTIAKTAFSRNWLVNHASL
jgi:hypothetical protein